MEIKTIVYFNSPEGDVKEREINIIPREGEVVEFDNKEYVVQYVRHSISEFIPDRFAPTKVLVQGVTTHTINIHLSYG